MKKQILFLTFFVAALLAGNSTAFGQKATPYTAPQTMSCAPDALHPTAGVPYIYTLDATPTDGTWNWFATKNASFITSGVLAMDSLKETANQILNASGNYGTTGSTNSVTISWTDALLAGTEYQGTGSPGTPTFVVGYYEAPSGECSDNIKVYELDPVNAFVVDVLSIDSTTVASTAPTYGSVPEQCVDNVTRSYILRRYNDI